MKAKTKKALKIAGWTAFGVGALAVAREAYLALGVYREERQSLYMAALARAKKLKRPLIVLKDPDAGFIHHTLGRDYQCGMICIDLNGCGGCAADVQRIADEPTHALSKMAPNSAVIFDGGYFPFAPSGAKLAVQMLRVAGEARNIFMHDVRPLSLTRLFEPKRKRTLTAAPQATGSIDWNSRWLSGENDGSTTEGLGYIPQPKMVYFERMVTTPAPQVYFER